MKKFFLFLLFLIIAAGAVVLYGDRVGFNVEDYGIDLAEYGIDKQKILSYLDFDNIRSNIRENIQFSKDNCPE
jgi:hypothetical protein